MAGIDRANRIKALVAAGWTELIERDRDPVYSPPPELWERRPKAFLLADAEDLQAILKPGANDD